MDGVEKGLWVFALWLLSLLSMMWLVMSTQDPTQWTKPGIMFAVVFVAFLVAFLFRITYLAGGRR